MRVFSEYYFRVYEGKRIEERVKGYGWHFGIKRRIFHHGYHVGNGQDCGLRANSISSLVTGLP